MTCWRPGPGGPPEPAAGFDRASRRTGRSDWHCLLAWAVHRAGGHPHGAGVADEGRRHGPLGGRRPSSLSERPAPCSRTGLRNCSGCARSGRASTAVSRHRRRPAHPGDCGCAAATRRSGSSTPGTTGCCAGSRSSTAAGVTCSRSATRCGSRASPPTRYNGSRWGVELPSTTARAVLEPNRRRSQCLMRTRLAAALAASVSPRLPAAQVRRAARRPTAGAICRRSRNRRGPGIGPAAAVPDRPKVRMHRLERLRSTNVVVDGGPAALLASLCTRWYSNNGGYEPTRVDPQ